MMVYIVTCGRYSDYHIVCACSDKTRADAFAAEFSDGSVEELEVDGGPLSLGLRYFEGSMGWNGVCEAHRRAPYETRLEPISVEKYDYSRYTNNPKNITEEQLRGFRFGCWAKDEQHAIKMANEKRAQLLAEDFPG